MDLSQIPLKDLEEEVARRKAEIKRLKKEAAENRICCRNCAFRVIGKSISTYPETWVCEKRPKDHGAYKADVPFYLRTFMACGRMYHDKCQIFIHAKSEEGKKIIKERIKQNRRYRIGDEE